MTASRNWTINEALADLRSLLDAARENVQYIVASDGRYKVSFDSTAGTLLEDVLAKDGPLEPEDIEGL